MHVSGRAEIIPRLRSRSLPAGIRRRSGFASIRDHHEYLVSKERPRHANRVAIALPHPKLEDKADTMQSVDNNERPRPIDRLAADVRHRQKLAAGSSAVASLISRLRRADDILGDLVYCPHAERAAGCLVPHAAGERGVTNAHAG